MTKSDWLNLPHKQRLDTIRGYLEEVVAIDRKQHEWCSDRRKSGGLGNLRHNMENEILKLLSFEKDK